MPRLIPSVQKHILPYVASMALGACAGAFDDAAQECLENVECQQQGELTGNDLESQNFASREALFGILAGFGFSYLAYGFARRREDDGYPLLPEAHSPIMDMVEIAKGPFRVGDPDEEERRYYRSWVARRDWLNGSPEHAVWRWGEGWEERGSVRLGRPPLWL